MDFKQLFDDDRAVSPVIGVILMVAITVILAAVIGTFVLGLGDQVQNTTPQASFGFDTTDNGGSSDGADQVSITHETGDTISGANLQVAVTGAPNTPYDWPNNNDVSAGSSITVTDSNAGTTGDIDIDSGLNQIAGETVRVVYNSPDSDSTSTLAKFEIPE